MEGGRVHPTARLWTALDGLDFDKSAASFFRVCKPGGIVLFSRNWESPDQLTNLLGGVKEAAKEEGIPAPFMGVDQEGGTVQRLGEPFPDAPSAEEVGKACRKEDSPEPAREAGKAMGRALSELGIDVSFAPVLDVNSNPKNPIIGARKRAFSTEPQEVALWGLAYARGLLEGGVLPCGKHFPGHGDTRKDSHKDLPVVLEDGERLSVREVFPFAAAARAQIPLLMTAHILYPALDSDFPATHSQKISTELLRTKLGFEGVLVTDDLGMAGAGDGPPSFLAKRAHIAGCDVLLVCEGGESAEEVAEMICGLSKNENAPSLQRLEVLFSMREAIKETTHEQPPPTSLSR